MGDYTVVSLSMMMKTNRGFIHLSREDVSIMLPGGRRRHLCWDSLYKLIEDEGADYDRSSGAVTPGKENDEHISQYG